MVRVDHNRWIGRRRSCRLEPAAAAARPASRSPSAESPPLEAGGARGAGRRRTAASRREGRGMERPSPAPRMGSSPSGVSALLRRTCGRLLARGLPARQREERHGPGVLTEPSSPAGRFTVRIARRSAERGGFRYVRRARTHVAPPRPAGPDMPCAKRDGGSVRPEQRRGDKGDGRRWRAVTRLAGGLLSRERDAGLFPRDCRQN